MSKFSDDMKSEIKDMKKKVKKINEEKESIALSLLKDYKVQNKRLFIIIILLCVMLTGIGIYTIWLLNDIEVVETTSTENYDMSTEDGNNNYIGGDNNGEIKNN